MTSSYLLRGNKQSQLFGGNNESSPQKGDVFFEFDNFRKDAQRKAQNAASTMISANEQSPLRSTQEKFSIQSLRKNSNNNNNFRAGLGATAASPLSLSQSNGFLSAAIQKEMRDSSFERQLAKSFNARPKQSQQLLSPRRNQKQSQTLSSFQLSPEKKLQSPARFIQKLGSPSKTDNSNRLEKRSNSVQSGGLQQLLDETRQKIQQNAVSPSRQRSSQQSYLGGQQRSSEVFSGSQTAYLIDKRAHDLEDYLMTLSPKDFNSLPRANIEQLIKLSSVIMSKVKNSAFYRTSLF